MNDAADSFIDLGDVSLRVRQRGVSGPALACIHEFGGSLESWQGVWAALSGQHRLLAHDLRGSGLSGKVRGELRIETHVDDLARLLDRLGERNPMVLVGTAVGAAVALGLAASRPERVRGVIALAPALGASASAVPTLRARADEVERLGMRAALETSMAIGWPAALREPPAAYLAYVARWLGNDPASHAAGMRMIATMDPLPWLPQIECPVLVLAGRLDANRTPQQIREKMQPLRRAQFIELDAGHFLAAQAPEEVARAIEGFLAGLE